MARYKGTFKVAANYEPLTASPFDARELVETKADLCSTLTWRQLNGDIWVYIGMKVIVAADPVEENNGQYILIDLDYSQPSSWRKQADERDIAKILEELESMKDPESATEVLAALEEYKVVNNQRVAAIEDLLVGIGGEGEPENVLAAIAELALEIPVATADILGGIRSAVDINGEAALNAVYVNAETGVAEVKAVSTDVLVQGEEELTLNGGGSF